MTEYPDEPVTNLPTPPRGFTDQKGRQITLRQADDDVEALVDMYLDFHPEDRAQGIPPTKEEDVREWLSVVMQTEGLNLIAWHEDSAVGHVMLVFDEEGAYELAIFVLQEYQGAGIGTELLGTALGGAATQGVERVWLSVERWNRPAVSLYKKIGFESCGDDRFEKMMKLRLD